MESGSSLPALFDRFFRVIDGGVIDGGSADVPLDEAALIIGAALAPQDDIDIERSLATLDRLADRIPVPTVEALVDVLFQGPEAFRGNNSDYYAAANSFLHRVLAARVGIPISLSILTIEVGRRIGLPLSGVGMPAHFLVGVRPENGLIPHTFIDPFHGGSILDVEGCRLLFHRMTGGSHSFDRRFLGVTPTLGIIERTLSNLKAIYTRNGDAISLGIVMMLRSRLPGIGPAEAEERRRIMVPFN